VSRSPVSSRADAAALHAAILGEGFAFVRGGPMKNRLAESGPLTDWPAFADSWHRLDVDAYMADGGRYRRRRHATFAAAPGRPIERQPQQPHFQPLDYNPLNGGVERWFSPVEPEIAEGPSLQTVLALCRSLFDGLAGAAVPWRVEVHQFRIEARREEPGRPTPEGLHRDGVDFVLVLLINRTNIASGMTTIHTLDGRELGHFTLTHPFDAAFVDDRRVAHGVTPVRALDPERPAYRDVLVLTFKASDGQ
jgi:hypothetical protein